MTSSTLIDSTVSTPNLPDITVSARTTFNIECDWKIPAFSKSSELVPERDPNYRFDSDTTRAVLAGFMHNRRVLLQGYHGTGKSSHIEQIAARLNWPCIRVNLDGHISRIDLIGRDAIVIKDEKQITEFRPGIIPWAITHPVALVLDEYDAARPDVLFVLQRLLEAQGKFTLLDQNRVITPHSHFRIFATANTIGLGDTTGLYHGTQALNQGQMDRWNLVSILNYLPAEEEIAIVLAKVPALAKEKKRVEQMVLLADLTRQGLKAGDISTVMSPRTVITWAENYQLFGNLETAFRLTFLNKCDETERALIGEYYERCLGVAVA